ncbi:MAG: hypothetical protein A3H33_09055 [Betaproteobacteria bacterium RIFCSPLOWO2_02_FULL_65_20]|nr:MAG: hypothetical protein A3H33_09055 [Betaproteobacteria bacterium RIFCSPLOWO2_02_FULL_65_20]
MVMSNLGECMLFYLKYAAEMERLYEAEEPKVEGLPNPDQVLKQIKLVGDTANREVAEFLETCVPGIEEHFRAISTVQRIRKKDMWVLSFKVGPKKATDRQFWIGVNIDLNQAALIPWVWCRGGRRAEDEMVRILGRGIKVRGWESGTVVLAEIKIPIPERLEEPVECDSLVAKVQQAFASFTERDVAAIDGITTNRGEA